MKVFKSYKKKLYAPTENLENWRDHNSFVFWLCNLIKLEFLVSIDTLDIFESNGYKVFYKNH